MKTRIAATLIALSSVLALTATPGTDLRTQTGRESLRFCLQQGGRTLDQCETYAQEAELYAVYTGQDSYFAE